MQKFYDTTRTIAVMMLNDTSVKGIRMEKLSSFGGSCKARNWIELLLELATSSPAKVIEGKVDPQ